MGGLCAALTRRVGPFLACFASLSRTDFDLLGVVISFLTLKSSAASDSLRKVFIAFAVWAKSRENTVPYNTITVNWPVRGKPWTVHFSEHHSQAMPIPFPGR